MKTPGWLPPAYITIFYCYIYSTLLKIFFQECVLFRCWIFAIQSLKLSPLMILISCTSRLQFHRTFQVYSPHQSFDFLKFQLCSLLDSELDFNFTITLLLTGRNSLYQPRFQWEWSCCHCVLLYSSPVMFWFYLNWRSPIHYTI